MYPPSSFELLPPSKHVTVFPASDQKAMEWERIFTASYAMKASIPPTISPSLPCRPALMSSGGLETQRQVDRPERLRMVDRRA